MLKLSFSRFANSLHVFRLAGYILRGTRVVQPINGFVYVCLLYYGLPVPYISVVTHTLGSIDYTQIVG